MFDSLKRIFSKKKPQKAVLATVPAKFEPKKKVKGELPKVGKVKIPPAFDSGLMKKLMTKGYKSGSLPKLEKYEKREFERLKKEARKRRKKKATKKKAYTAPAVKAYVPPKPKETNKVVDEIYTTTAQEDAGGVGIMYGEAKKPLDYSKLPKADEDK